MAELGPLLRFKAVVEKQALVSAEEQGILSDARVTTDVNGEYFGRPQEFANHRCSFYLCHGCDKPYFGGLIDCEQEINAAEQAERRKEDLLCQDCLIKELGVGEQNCEEHGTSFIDWKCMFCCSVAVFKCFGIAYMCNECHDIMNMSLPRRCPRTIDCHGVDCPLGIPHPPAATNLDFKQGGAFPLGCSLCRTADKYTNLQNHTVKQVAVSAAERPDSWGKEQKDKLVIRPSFEIELPDFIVHADELFNAEM